ncbi:MAG: serine/threonine protein kinase [Myxococcales bacterium]|nr:serine/threonine protein kinase [Myxococcales bacterium]
MNLPANRQHTIRGLSPGTRLGRYTVVRRVGSGGMAELYLARLDGPSGFVKPVALKLMHPHLSDDAHFAQMFLKEARIAATLEHPAIVQVLDVGEFGGEYFMALEFVHGKDLRRLLADLKAPMPTGAALRVVLETARALHYAHRLRDPGGRPLGIVHRDVSPSNVLLSYQGAVKLADFGVAKMAGRTIATASGALKGKMGYMSPEQCLQENVDARSDVFSLGVVLYESTTGRRAFRADQPVTVMNRVIDGQWVPPDHFVPGYPPELYDVVARALEPDADRRYPSAEAMAKDLEAFAAAHGIDTGPEVLASLLGQQYGEPEQPDLEVPTLQTPKLRTVALDEKETIPIEVPTMPGSRGGRRLATGVALVGVLAVGGVLGWQVARTTGSSEARAQPAPGAPVDSVGPAGPANPVNPAVPSAAVAAPGSAREPGPGAPERAGADGPEAADDGEVADDGEAPAADGGLADDAALAETPTTRRSTTRRSTNKKKRRKSGSSDQGELDALLPPSAR